MTIDPNQPTPQSTDGANATTPPKVDSVRGNQSQQSSGSDDMGPYKEAFKDMLSDLLKSVPVLKDLADQADKIAKKTEEINKSTTTFSNKVKGMTSDYKYMVSGVDDVLGDVTDSFKKLADYQREMGQHAAKNAASHEHVLEVLEKMQEANEAILKKGLGSPEQLASVKRHRDALNKALDEAKKKTGNLVSPDFAIDLLAPVQKATTQMQKLGVEAKKARLSNLGHDIRSAEKGMQALFGLKDRASKYRGLADVFHELKAAKTERRKGQLGNFQAHKEKLMSAPELGLDQYRRADGSLDRKRYLKDAALQAREQGYTGLAGRAIAQTALDHHEGKTSSMLTRILAQGEGHLGRGVTSVALDALEGAGGAVGGVVAGAGGVLGFMEVLKELIDKDQKQKAEMDEKLGSSGIYDNGDRGADIASSLNNVRGNLNVFNARMGIGYDKNLAIASAISEAGLSNRNLNRPVTEEQKDTGFLNGSFGAMQQNVYAFGKAAGLDSSQTMAETLKLVTQYKQSLVSTEDFFVQITKDSRAAGISTMKYIGLLDEVNSHYDRSNKLIMATVDTIRILGVTGRNTVEDISEQMNVATNDGQKRSEAQRAYGSQLLLNDPAANKAENDMRQRMEDMALDNLYKAFGKKDAQGNWQEGVAGPGSAFGKIGEKITRAKVEAMMKQGTVAMGDAISREFSDDPNAAKAAETAMRNYRTAQDQNLKLSSGDQSSVLKRITVSDDQLRQGATTYALMKKNMEVYQGQTNAGTDIFNKDQRSAMKSSRLFSGVGEAYGTKDPGEALDKIQDRMTSFAEAWVKLGQQGLSDTEPGSPERDHLMKTREELYQRLEGSGIFKGLTGSHDDQLTKALNDTSKALVGKQYLTRNDPKARDALMRDALIGNAGLYEGLAIHDKNQAAGKAEDEAQQKVLNTTTLDKLLHDVFDHFMTELLGLVTSIEKTTSFFGLKQGYVSPELKKQTEAIDAATEIATTRTNALTKISATQSPEAEGEFYNAHVMETHKDMLLHPENYQKEEIDSNTKEFNRVFPYYNKDAADKRDEQLDPGGQLRSWHIDPMKYSLLPTSKVIPATDKDPFYGGVSTIISNTFNSIDFGVPSSNASPTFKELGQEVTPIKPPARAAVKN